MKQILAKDRQPVSQRAGNKVLEFNVRLRGEHADGQRLLLGPPPPLGRFFFCLLLCAQVLTVAWLGALDTGFCDLDSCTHARRRQRVWLLTFALLGFCLRGRAGHEKNNEQE